ncbi:MAG: M3 family oligoendopeptidase [Bacteroidia bacterium]|nr:M3 family oligoendopeptidase [Bacteroidia bacterium]MDW8347531.1 M3 family oligoendopeptidase [Bacteroidia bacterium]
MKFSQYPYERPDISSLEEKFFSTVKKIKRELVIRDIVKCVDELNQLRKQFETMATLASIRYTLDTQNPQYQAEQDFFDVHYPIYQSWLVEFYKMVWTHPSLYEFKSEYGWQFIKLADCAIRCFNKNIVDDLKQENQLVSEYTKLIASAKIEFEGKTYNLTGLVPFMQDVNRDRRLRAHQAYLSFFVQQAHKLDELFDTLVKLRTTIAQKLGFENYVRLGYLRLSRVDYTDQEVARYREYIRKYVVPIAQILQERKRKRLHLDKLYFYDEKLKFNSGNPTPKGDPQWILQQGKTMYQELSPETAEFFTFMQENELMDVINREGKASGGYCTYLSAYKAPYIFSNFNGTAHDVEVLTHEAGHAFQMYCSREQPLPEYYMPTYEACEIHSMGMEFITWKWMELFFKEDTEKFKFDHISSALTFLPYSTMVDEFQHIIYQNPNYTPQERKQVWQTLEKKYLPYRDYADLPFASQGGIWQAQSHIYANPFYYIDYALAQICALQYWRWYQEQPEAAWQSYLTLCKAGGSKSFLELLELGGLSSPFDEDTVRSVVEHAYQWLDQIDDSKF